MTWCCIKFRNVLHFSIPILYIILNKTSLLCVSWQRQLEPEISRTAAAIATPPSISANPRMLDSARIITPVTCSRPCRRSLALPQEVNRSTKSSRSEVGDDVLYSTCHNKHAMITISNYSDRFEVKVICTTAYCMHWIIISDGVLYELFWH